VRRFVQSLAIVEASFEINQRFAWAPDAAAFESCCSAHHSQSTPKISRPPSIKPNGNPCRDYCLKEFDKQSFITTVVLSLRSYPVIWLFPLLMTIHNVDVALHAWAFDDDDSENDDCPAALRYLWLSQTVCAFFFLCIRLPTMQI
jgi:hypothetical protein